MDYSRKKLDLAGQRFGKLTVLRPAENAGRYTAWLCRCECGREAVVLTRRLRNGCTKSCGCAKRGVEQLNYVGGTCVEMIRTNTVRRNNTSGVPGVDWLKRKQMWRATICFQGERHYLGSYREFEDAVAARKRGEKEYHDRFLKEYVQTGTG